MTMSVGLAKIQNDPNATPMTRKALGALSTPGLLVHDTGLSIDGEGRIYIKLKSDGGILQGDEGLYLEPEPIVIGIDSHVDLFSEEHDREWNARLTGSAPNFIESGLAIGTEDFSGTFASPDVDYDIPKVAITATTAQLRLAYDLQNFTQVKVFNAGEIGFFAVGSNPGFFFESGDGINPSGGVRIGRGSTIIESVKKYTTSALFTGGGTVGSISWQEVIVSLTADPDRPVRVAQDIVTICPTSAVPSVAIAWTARITATDQVTIRLAWYDEYFGSTIDWLILIHRMDT